MDESASRSEHPLLASTVIARAGTDPAPTEQQLWVDCPTCHRHQALAECAVEPADDPEDITAYRCVDGCAIVLATGHPSPMPIPGSGRYRLGDYVLAPAAASGLLINMPSGSDIRLALPLR